MRGAWRQFHGNASNLGWKFRSTRPPLHPEWRLEIGDIAASPVVDAEGVIYLGSAEGHLIAVNPDGTERWRKNHGSPITAAPAVAEDGSIYFIRQVKTGTDTTPDGELYFVYHSILTKADPSGNLLWAVELPDNGFTTGAPKLWSRTDGDRIFIYFIRRSTLEGELCMISAEGQLQAFSGPLGCPWPINGTPKFIKVVTQWVKGFWESITFQLEFDASGVRIHPRYLDPTVAITDADNLVDEGEALIAIADHMCNLGVFRYDGSRLVRQWWKLQELEVRRSSPLIDPFGILIIGDEKGKVTAFDVLTGREIWTYDAEEPVLSVPAMFGGSTFAVSKRHLHQINSHNGHQINKDEFTSDNGVHTLSSPALSSKWVHIAHDAGLVSYELGEDLDRRAHDLDYRLGPLSPSPAIGAEGELYVIHDGSELWAYAGP